MYAKPGLRRNEVESRGQLPNANEDKRMRQSIGFSYRIPTVLLFGRR